MKRWCATIILKNEVLQAFCTVRKHLIAPTFFHETLVRLNINSFFEKKVFCTPNCNLIVLFIPNCSPLRVAILYARNSGYIHH